MAKYDEKFWNNKWPKSPILYSGRALRGQTNRISVDVKNFITTNDVLLQQTVDKYRLKKRNYNDTAWEVQKWVVKFLTYKFDDEINQCPEFWQFPFESLASGVGDCEDGGILIAALCIQAGIPIFRIKVAAGYVQAAPTAPQGGHGYCVYLADRKESARKMEWVVLDWCYFEDSAIHPSKKPLAKDGGYNKCYKNVWFSFNSEYSWNQQSLKLGGRISENQTKRLEEVVEEVKSLDSLMEEIDKKLK